VHYPLLWLFVWYFLIDFVLLVLCYLDGYFAGTTFALLPKCMKTIPSKGKGPKRAWVDQQAVEKQAK
jgi:hypothetical protein